MNKYWILLDSEKVGEFICEHLPLKLELENIREAFEALHDVKHVKIAKAQTQADFKSFEFLKEQRNATNKQKNV